MKVILAFDSFKGSLTAEQATNAVAMGIREIFPTAEIICLPMADGGEGTTEILVRYTRAKWSTCKVNDSLMRPIFVNYAIEENQRIALMEMAEVAGLILLQPNEQKPMKTTTFGVGEMILNAVKAGVKHILIGIGGSATSDGGAGMLAALGAKFYINNQLVKYPKGRDLIHLTSVDLSLLSVFQDIQIEVLCDVNNPLYGYNGAAYVYAPQKGASKYDVEILDRGLRNLAYLCKIDPTIPGSGAAGGLGYAFCLLGAQLRRGVEVLIEYTGLINHLNNADLVLTGEGKIDSQTLNNKLPFGIMSIARTHNVPTIVLAGCVANKDLLVSAGFNEAVCINPPNTPLSEAMCPKVATSRLRNTTKEVIKRVFSIDKH
ncbi:glycerate kinase [Prevotella aurantiaca]|jgi:glycerate kinase|uniref:Glycerate kinase n=1 Tax=Prevotella aurantiaca TaxID=596085 RepID=A0A930MZJ2_9BACT|nr:glycerate kinase [Prevotella aurantiaca]MBF1384460.1 glycerate kinase [Prevotella aurantiaca]